MRRFVPLLLLALFAVGATTPTQPLALDLRASQIAWTVAKVGKDYHGLVGLEDARLSVSDSTLSGYLIFDTGGATCANATGEELDEVMTTLRERFFETDRYPRGHLVIQDARRTGPADDDGFLPFEVTGDLRVKGESQPVTFSVRVRPHAEPGTIAGEATVEIERARWGLHYGDSLVDRMKDQAIADAIVFHAVFVAR
ncbi:MAG: YceI family protein [Bacteroidota bacterium]